MPDETPGSPPARRDPPASAQGADLAREILAQAKSDSRERARGRRPGGTSRSASVGGAGRRRQGGMGGGTGEARTSPEAGADAVEGIGEGAGAEPTGLARTSGSARRRARVDDDGQPPRRPRLPGIASPGREWREPVAFGPAITRLLAARGWKEQAADAGVLSRWDAIVGPDIAEHCAPVALVDGHLELVAESTAWATQLRMLSRQILGILHRELGPQVVRRITVRGPTAPSWRHGPIRTAGRGPRDTYG